MHFEGVCNNGYICSTALMISPVDMKYKTFKCAMCFAIVFCYFTGLIYIQAYL